MPHACDPDACSRYIERKYSQPTTGAAGRYDTAYQKSILYDSRLTDKIIVHRLRVSVRFVYTHKHTHSYKNKKKDSEHKYCIGDIFGHACCLILHNSSLNISLIQTHSHAPHNPPLIICESVEPFGRVPIARYWIYLTENRRDEKLFDNIFYDIFIKKNNNTNFKRYKENDIGNNFM